MGFVRVEFEEGSQWVVEELFAAIFEHDEQNIAELLSLRVFDLLVCILDIQ